MHFPRLAGHRARGQTLPLTAIIMVFLIMLMTTGIEVHERVYQRNVVEDSLQQATRSAAQTFDYAQFAANQNGFVVEGGAVTKTGCASAPANSARAIACQVFIANLQGMARGLLETPEATAERVAWTIYPGGSTQTCTFPAGRASVSSDRPLVCATLRPRMEGMLGWGEFSPQIDASEVLDRSQ
ncbi:MAG: hypothetical protein RLZZ387_2530 [Chloroflexota bacterium]|jgi:Flp pilus assembly protein TadG